MAVKAANTGMIILGGGLVKHHICNANLMVSMWILLSIASGSILHIHCMYNLPL